MEKKINWKKTSLKLLLGILAICIILCIIYLILHHFGFDSLSKEKIQSLIEKTGIYGKLCFIAISFLQVTLVPIPSVVTILVGSYAFGFFEGFVLSLIGILLGSIVMFFLGRKLGRKFVNWAFGDKEAVDYYLNKIKGKEIVILFFMFFLPFFPDDALCAIAGITKIKTSYFLVIQLITRITSILGTLTFMSGDIIPYHGWGLVIIIGVSVSSIILFIIAYKNSEKISNSLEKTSEKIASFFKRKKT